MAWSAVWAWKDCVGFIGFQEDPVEAFRGLDVVVHASTRPEPFGLTIVEAMACGKAVVAAAAGGAAELFRDGRDALGVASGDAAALAAALRRLVEDVPPRSAGRAGARRTVLARFTHEGLGARFFTSTARRARPLQLRPAGFEPATLGLGNLTGGRLPLSALVFGRLPCRGCVDPRFRQRPRFSSVVRPVGYSQATVMRQ